MTWFDKIRLYLIYTTAVTLIVLAVAFSVLRAVLPHATGYVDDLEQAISQQIGLPVSIDSMDADMYWLVPRLKLVDVIIYDKTKQRELLHLDEAFFALAFVDSILELSPTVGEISLVGADLYIERHSGNRWRIQGVEFGGDGVDSTASDSSGELIAAVKNTSFSLLESNIHWQDYRLNSGQLDFIGANVYIEEFFGSHGLEIKLQLPEKYGKSLRLVVKTASDIENLLQADLDVYLQADSIDLGQWLSVLDVGELPQLKGVFSGEAWFSRYDGMLSQVTIDTVIKQLDVAGKKQTHVSLDDLVGKFEWRKTESGWELNSNDVFLVKQGVIWPELSAISVAQDEAGLSLAATYLRSQDLVEIASVIVDEELLGQFEAYNLNRLTGDFYNLSLFIPVDEASKIKLSTTFNNTGFQLPESEISLRGIDGFFVYEEGHGRLDLLSEAVVMDFGSLFRQPLEADLLEGSIFISQIENNWNITSEDFYFLNQDVEIDTRLKIIADEEGGLFTDVQSDFINAIGSSIHKYYPVSIMSDELLAWLDMAITDGYVESGSFILHGDLGAFPYPENDGVMQVVFDTNYLTLNFLEGWPNLNNVSSHIRFHNSSLLINEASGQTYRGTLTQTEARIPDLDSPRLFIDGHVEAPAEDLQQYVWDSGLSDILGAAMNEFQASGKTQLELQLEVPLDNDDPVLAKGVLQFDKNELFFPVMDYALSSVSGRLSFEGDRLTANGVQAVFENAPVSIDVISVEEITADLIETDSGRKLSANNHVSETIFSIKGRLPIDGLLKKFEWIPKAWVEGESDWDVAVHLPMQSNDYSVRVDMHSNLEGMVISLSDAVSKAVDESLMVDVEIKALDDALQIDVKSGSELSLFATRNDEDIWSFVVDSSLIRGRGEFAEDLNKDSIATLDIEYVDLLTLFKSTKKGGEDISLAPTFFPSLKFKSKVLVWDDWEFNNAELETSWHSHGMLIDSVSLQGPALKIKGRGSWLTSWQHEHESNFKLFVNSSDLGHTMSSLHLTDAMSRCEYAATVDWRWFEEPYKFSWQTVEGSSNFEMKNGAVKAIDPGAGGRIVGLLNVFKLFNRLTLDFKDVSSEGFVFDSITGDFQFHDGIATTRNVEVSAAAADMRLTGDIGMVDRDYDMLMQVRPRTSAAAFTTGALAGGPILGAGLVLINKLFGLEKSSYDEHKITGSWEDPKVEQIEQRKLDDETKEDEDE